MDDSSRSNWTAKDQILSGNGCETRCLFAYFDGIRSVDALNLRIIASSGLDPSPPSPLPFLQRVEMAVLPTRVFVPPRSSLRAAPSTTINTCSLLTILAHHLPTYPSTPTPTSSLLNLSMACSSLSLIGLDDEAWEPVWRGSRFPRLLEQVLHPHANTFKRE